MDARDTHEMDQLLRGRRDHAIALALDAVAYRAVLLAGKLPEALVDQMTADFARRWVAGATEPEVTFAMPWVED